MVSFIHLRKVDHNRLSLKYNIAIVHNHINVSVWGGERSSLTLPNFFSCFLFSQCFDKNGQQIGWITYIENVYDWSENLCIILWQSSRKLFYPHQLKCRNTQFMVALPFYLFVHWSTNFQIKNSLHQDSVTFHLSLSPGKFSLSL